MTSKQNLKAAILAGLVGVAVICTAGTLPAPRLTSDTAAAPFWQLHGTGVLPAAETPEIEQLRIAARNVDAIQIAAAE